MTAFEFGYGYVFKWKQMLPNNTKFEETAMKTKLHFSVV